MFFKDRVDAGKQLSLLLDSYKNEKTIVYGLPRGGVIVAKEIAEFLQAPLELLFAHKIGYPLHSEYAIAAVSESGHVVKSFMESNLFSSTWFEKEKQHQLQEIQRKRQLYLKNQLDLPVEGKIAIIVDDGIATGLTLQAGILELKERRPEKIVVAMPIAPQTSANVLKTMVDDWVGFIVEDHEFLGAVGAYYANFGQTEDEEVIKALDAFKNHSK